MARREGSRRAIGMRDQEIATRCGMRRRSGKWTRAVGTTEAGAESNQAKTNGATKRMAAELVMVGLMSIPQLAVGNGTFEFVRIIHDQSFPAAVRLAMTSVWETTRDVVFG